MKRSSLASLCAALVLASCSPHTSAPLPGLASIHRASMSAPGSGAHFVAEYPISGPSFALASGNDGNVWFAEAFNSKVGRITPAGVLTEFGVPLAGATRDVAPGPDGDMWFTLANTASGGYLGSITSSGTIALHQLPTRGPKFLTTGPDGNIWYTDDSSVIGKYQLNGTVTQYPTPTANSSPRGIAVGPDGNLWFTEFNSSKIAKITTSGVITEYSVAMNPFGTPAFIDGHVWANAQNEFVTLTFGGHARALPLPDLPGGQLGGAQGRIWVSFQDLNEIASMNFDGSQMRTYQVPTAGATPISMVYGSDGNIWFSEPLAPTPQIGVFHP